MKIYKSVKSTNNSSTIIVQTYQTPIGCENMTCQRK